ncbi:MULTISPECIES: hypothetical protein [unclassified Streptococcus]|uniref:hypothetical protein n=1 Tax=unclassified Streptococcus TaxID=2608887 RepID=UPI001F0DEB08|nr:MULTISPECIES: hypothetical protein [unclassified Streptococcus]
MLFLIDNDRIKPEALSKSNLLKLFNEIYQLEDIDAIQIPKEDEIDNIKNPVEKEIISQIIQKVIEFVNNLEQIKQDIESSFPILNTEEQFG